MAERQLKDGSIYRVAPMLATQAIVLQSRLLRIFGGAIDRLPEILNGYGDAASPEAKAKSNAAAIGAMADIFAKAEPNEVARIIAEVIEAGMINPGGTGNFRKVNLDGDFTDRRSDLYPTVIFAMREQFGDFLAEILPNGVPGAARKLPAKH